MSDSARPPDDSRRSLSQSDSDSDPSRTLEADTTIDSSRGVREAGGGADGIRSIGPYRLLQKLGEGGMGQVWLAEQTSPVRRQVALKLIKGGMYDETVLLRFQSERQSLAMMDHPSIAKVFDAGATADGQPYFVMEYVAGPSITAYCDQKRLSIKHRLALLITACEAVQHAHQKAVIHRDLKPANILVVEVDGKPLPRIIDFGLAKATTPNSGEAHLTRVGGFVGTPGYMSPEQANPSMKGIDTRADVYSLGAILYELLVGSAPFELTPNLTIDEFLRAVREVDAPRPTARLRASTLEVQQLLAVNRSTDRGVLIRQVSGDLGSITLKALEKDRERRYDTAFALAADLERYLRNEPVLAVPPSAAYRASKFVRRHRGAVALTTLAFLAAAAGVTGTLMQARKARAQRDLALQQLRRREAVSEFNNFLLSDAAPGGKPFTVNELLGRAEKVLEQQHSADDTNRAELLVSIGDQYSDQDRDADAQRILEEAYKLSRSLPKGSTRANASCALAGALARGGDLKRAETLFQEAMSELPAESQYDLEQVYCLRRGSEVAQERGDSQEGITRMEAAKKILGVSPLDSDLQELTVSVDLAEAYRMAGLNQKAASMFERASELLSSLGRDDTQEAVVIFNDWALALDRLGRPLEADRLYLRAINVSRVDKTEETVSPMVLNNYAKTLRQLGRLDAAADYAERAYLRAKQLDDQLVIYQALYVRALVYIDQGDFTRATAMLADLMPILRRSLPPGNYWFGALASAQAMVAAGHGDFQTATGLADQSITITEAAIKNGGQGADLLPMLLVRRSSIRLRAGQNVEAADDAARALRLLQDTTNAAAFSSHVGRAYYVLGCALNSQGKKNEAEAAFRPAVEHLQNTLGPDHPETRSARLEAGMESKP